jgi:hypothetical protein
MRHFHMLLVVSALAGAAVAAPPPDVPELRDDPRLATRVTIEEADRPLGALLAELGRSTQLYLFGAPL